MEGYSGCERHRERGVRDVDRCNGTTGCRVGFFFFSSRRRHTRLQGDWSSDVCSSDLITPQFFWSKRVRQNTTLVWVLSIFVNVGMWFERFVIIVTSLARDFLPSS